MLPPAGAAVEAVAARWLLELLHLPAQSSVGFVSGATIANFVGLAAARGELLHRQGWNVEDDGLYGAPPLRVLIGADGLPQKADIRTSSGFERLDQAALATVMKWRYVPGKRAGVPEAMWFNVPINFVLE